MKSYTEEKRIRPDILTSVVFWSVVVIMIFKIIGNRIYGDLGSGFGAAPFAFFYMFYGCYVLAVQKAVWLMVRIRARRSQFLNAETNMKRSRRLFVFISFVTGALLAALSYVISKNLFGSGRGYLQFLIVAIMSLIFGAQGVYRGYLQGLGYTRPIVISDLLFAVTAAASGTVISVIMYFYGLKVNELFHVQEYSAIYGSIGSIIGLLIASIICFIQIMISFSIRKNEIADIIKNGAPRYLDNKNDVISGIRPILYLYLTPAFMSLLSEGIYMAIHKKDAAGTELLLQYGMLSGKVFPVVTALSVICCLPFIKTWNRVMARIERDEYEVARDRLKKLIRYSTVVFIPVTIVCLALSETINVALFGKSNDTTNSLLTLAAPVIFLACLAVFGSWLMSHMGKSLLLVINLSVGWGVFVIGNIVFGVVLDLGLYGIVLTHIVSFLIYDIISFSMIFKMLKYRQEFMSTFLLPVAASAAAGLVIYFINMIFVNLIGDALTLLICILVFWIVYMLIIIALKRIKTYELRFIPLGGVFHGIASRMQPEEYEEWN
ncbi:polysaccharide biosynthesis C-terminal domain-containing protein [Butyrivibrio sp. DSM 10294]|uniref:polysaccharide biosynthesis C-terminal domain-containing protein n=1 Tax=Butyrivibrio sp. DSM 10294 TaxID=2972457 RepID=UPI00234EB199|nr:polysaccharide biosynthesis C-terminal domain-containing protein [Butyrivibrio sp. DSM 10294]MDC7295380.1 polysaccharide biosynthesis C-terminal domain-containing protein [Butyrivibrio sp. DSM 10294]